VQWKNLKSIFDQTHIPHRLDAVAGPKVVICYDGETSRLATAVMRARGIEAFSIRGGMPALLELCSS